MLHAINATKLHILRINKFFILKNAENILILAIESSCDDTSAAILMANPDDIQKGGKVLSNCVVTQEIHKLYGGVVPEVASRQHQINIVPIVDAAIKKAGISKHDIDAVAFTRGPGLIGSLLVGVSFAKSFALALGVPMIEVNHMQAHVLAHFAEDPKPDFPFLCLTVSGGHTQIIKVKYSYKGDLGLGYTLFADEERWYAKGFGLIYDKITEVQTSTTTELETTRIQIF